MGKNTNSSIKETWNTFTGTMRVWGTEFKGKKNKTFLSFSCSVGKKNEDGDYDNEYIKVKFSKDCEDELDLQEGENIIDIENGFLSVDVWEDKKGNQQQKLVLVITEASPAETKSKSKKSKKASSDDEDD